MTEHEQFPEFIRSLPMVDLPLPGVEGWLLKGEDKQVVFVEFHENADVPEHEHSEQWEIPVAGTVVLHMNGVSREYHPGEQFFIPAQVPHAASVSSGYKAIIIFNSPDRYRSKS